MARQLRKYFASGPMQPRKQSAGKAPPGNSSEFLADANAASGTARGTWIAFLGLITYLLVTLASITHEMLLLNDSVRLPIVNVDIPLYGFFLAAPILLVTVHLGLLSQHVMLAKKYDQFCNAISKSEEDNPRSNPDRGRVNSYVFAQLLAGPQSPRVLELLMHSMVLFTIVFMPVVTLIYFQIKFLPFHDELVTWIHRIILLVDLCILLVVWPFTRLPFWRSRHRPVELGPKSWPWRMSRLGVWTSLSISVTIILLSMFVATIPGENLERLAARSDFFAVDVWDRASSRLDGVSRQKFRRTFFLTNWLFDGEIKKMPFARPSHIAPFQERLYSALHGLTPALSDWFATLSPFSRHIIANKLDLVPDQPIEPAESSVVLKGRALRNAILSDTDLHRADLEDAELQGAIADYANLSHADLRAAKLIGAYLTYADLSHAMLNGANFSDADLFGVKWDGADLRGADFSRAMLNGANLSGAAGLEGAGTGGTSFEGADLTRANLKGTDLRNVQFQGANLTGALLQGANLTGADLRGANLTRAQLQDADLTRAKLAGAILTDAQLPGADWGDPAR